MVVQWGCGAPCMMMALVDANTGVVHLPPLSVDNTFAEPLLTIGPESLSQNPAVEFRRDSRLMLVRATPHCKKQGTKLYSTTSSGTQITGPSFIGSRWIEYGCGP